MNAQKRHSEIVHHIVEPRLERRSPTHQHVIVSGAKRSGWRAADERAQAPPHAVALDGIADLFGDCKSDPRRPGLGAPSRLQDKCACRGSRASCGSLGSRPKITSAFQPLHETDIMGPTSRDRHSERPIFGLILFEQDRRPDRAARSAQALNFLRPRARRAAKTLRPPLVAMRVRKPWRRLRTNLLGW
jgi:hypothetical protein